MIRPEDIRSLTDFKRDTLAHLRGLRKTGRPRVLTVNGKARAVVLDPAAYQRLVDELDRAKVIAGVEKGLREFKEGKGKPARAALEDAFRKIKAARKGARRRRTAA